MSAPADAAVSGDNDESIAIQDDTITAGVLQHEHQKEEEHLDDLWQEMEQGSNDLYVERDLARQENVAPQLGNRIVHPVYKDQVRSVLKASSSGEAEADSGGDAMQPMEAQGQVLFADAVPFGSTELPREEEEQVVRVNDSNVEILTPSDRRLNSRADTTRDEATEKARRMARMVFVFVVVGFAAVVSGVVCATGNTCFGGGPAVPIDVVAVINNITVTGRTIAYPSTNTSEAVSPEELALEWLVAMDPSRLELSLDTPVTRFRLRQRYALLALWFHTFTEDLPWKDSQGWLVAKHECEWSGIRCTEISVPGAASQQMVDSVTGIILEGNRLQGRIPNDLALLSSTLANFDVSYNSMVGNLSPIASLTNLELCFVQHNSFSGTLPEAIGRLTDLKEFVASHNRGMSGTFPEEYGKLTNLRRFLTHSISLTGTLPDSIGNWSNIIEFAVHTNGITGSIPKSLKNWLSLRFFWVDANALVGSLPDLLGCTSLEWFGIGENELTGTLPDMGVFSDLELFYVNSNKFNGTIPVSIANLSSLSTATFHDNAFTGSVPSSLCELVSRNDTLLELLTADCVTELDCSCCTECY